MVGIFALALASSADVPLIDIDNTVWIQLGIFLLLMLFLSKVVFRPYLKLRDARASGIEGSRVEAISMHERATATLAALEQRLAAARQRGAEERGRIQAQAAEREHQILAAAREEASRSLEQARASLADQAATIRGQLRAHVSELAEAVARKLLRREV
jgi:F-type H+-transporting ATPase subunit b